MKALHWNITGCALFSKVQPNDHPQSPQQQQVLQQQQQQVQQQQQQQQASRNNGKAAQMPREKPQIEEVGQPSRPALPHRLIVVPDPANVWIIFFGFQNYLRLGSFLNSFLGLLVVFVLPIY